MCLLGQLCPSDDSLDDLLLLPSLLVVTPPHRPLVFTLETKVLARLARRLALVTLLSS